MASQSTILSLTKGVCRSPGSSYATPALPDWRLLPDGVIVHISDRLLTDNDLDYYVDFRAVCGSWRHATVDPKIHAGDPLFQPKTWAVQKHFGSPRQNRVVSMVNLKTCRLVIKEIPLLDNYRYINATDGGLLVLWDGSMPPWQPCRALVLNPFTRSMAYFSVPIFTLGICSVAMSTSPLMIFASNLFNFLGWADLNSQDFEEHNVRYPDLIADMKLFTGDIYFVNRHGSIFSTASDDITNEGTQHSARMIRMNPTTIHDVSSSLVEHCHPHYYLIESAGELLLVTRPFATNQHVLVHKVDTVNKVLKPMVSIGSRAIFISQVRSFSIDTNMFASTVEGDCIYFVETIANLVEHHIVASLVRLADQRHEDIMQFGLFQGHFGPPTLVEVLADHCRYSPEHELEHYYGWKWDDDDI
ncbi:unnamed protein product [Urochloa humidicola]